MKIFPRHLSHYCLMPSHPRCKEGSFNKKQKSILISTFIFSKAMPGLMVPWIVLSILGLILLLIFIIVHVVVIANVSNPHHTTSNLGHAIFNFLGLGFFAFAIGYYSLIVVWSFR